MVMRNFHVDNLLLGANLRRRRGIRITYVDALGKILRLVLTLWNSEENSAGSAVRQ